MGLLNWMSGKVHAKLLDEADKELAFLRTGMGTDRELWERFFTVFEDVKGNVHELTGSGIGDRLTRAIRAMYPDRRNVVATRLMEIGIKNRVDLPGSAACKLIATWIKLVEVLDAPETSVANAARATNLLASYEAVLERAALAMDKEE